MVNANNREEWASIVRTHKLLKGRGAKEEVKLSLCIIKHYTIKAYGGSRCIDKRSPDVGTSWR
jgi:hypothetical protein